ncbi:MAG: glycosyltransferase, partial [bacterium]
KKRERDQEIANARRSQVGAWGRGWFPKLIKQIEAQTFKKWELIIVKGDTRPSRAKNVGIAISRGRYILNLDDDSQLPQREAIENLIMAMESDEKIGAVGAGKLIPPYANRLCKRIMKELPRQQISISERIIDSDMIESGCWLLRKEAVIKVGGENELLFRGDDDYLRNVIREAGYRTVIAPNTYYYHMPPSTLIGFIKFAVRNGRGSAITQRLYPQWIYTGAEQHRMDVDFQPPFIKRLLRAIKTTIASIFLLHPIYVIYRLFYAIGYLWGWLKPKVPD